MLTVTYGGGGWVRVEDYNLHLRFTRNGQIAELHMTGPVTAADLRGIPLARISAQALSRPDLLSMPGPPPDQLDAVVRRLVPRRPRKRAGLDTGARLAPPNAGLTDDFLRSVADAYMAAIARGESPNKALAKQIGHQKSRTAERWVYLARKKGYLPAARRGAVQ
jgi:hypothetical protein